jgi:hypothetical protein
VNRAKEVAKKKLEQEKRKTEISQETEREASEKRLI